MVINSNNILNLVLNILNEVFQDLSNVENGQD